jgi:hypothetical protein
MSMKDPIDLAAFLFGKLGPPGTCSGGNDGVTAHSPNEGNVPHLRGVGFGRDRVLLSGRVWGSAA